MKCTAATTFNGKKYPDSAFRYVYRAVSGVDCRHTLHGTFVIYFRYSVQILLQRWQGGGGLGTCNLTNWHLHAGATDYQSTYTTDSESTITLRFANKAATVRKIPTEYGTFYGET